MALTTPTTQDVANNIIAQLEASLKQTIPVLPKSFFRVISKADAGVFILLFKYGGFMFLQDFVSSASDQETEVNGVVVVPLTEWGRLVGAGDPIAATSAELLIDITVTNQVGSLPSGSALVNSNNGVTYLTVGSVLLDAPIVQATIIAVSDQNGGNGAGAIGNLDPGAIVAFANPLANVARNAVVDSQTVTGADAESTDAYRQRVLDRFQKRPQGGAPSDYELWGEEVAGIANIYPYTGILPGTVDVFVESATEVDGIPTAAQLTAVEDSIEFDLAGLASRRPANAFANVISITRTVFDVRLTGLVVDDPATVQANILEATTDFFLESEPFIDGLSVLPRRDRITSNELNGIIQDIVSLAGGIYGVAIISVATVDTDLFNLGEGEKAKLGVLSFI